MRLSFLKISFIALLIAAATFSCEQTPEEPQLPKVIVSLAPYKFVVEEIASDTVKVVTMVPTGADPHSYEPTTKKVLEAAKASLWLQIGEAFEERATPALLAHNAKMRIIDMREGVNLIHEGHNHHNHCSHHHCTDPHIWLSPRLMEQQSRIIKEALSALFPEHRALYEKNGQRLRKRLESLDREIATLTKGMKQRTLLVSHPAFAYFCRDYGLRQLSIEFEGKAPTPQHITHLLRHLRQSPPPFIYIQKQHRSKGTELIAKELGAELVEVDPLAENYIENLRAITHLFSAQ